MIEDRVLRLEAQMRDVKEKIASIWSDYRSWKVTNDRKVAARERERCATLADSAKEQQNTEELEEWNAACTYIAEQIRRRA
jgi:hypothetical protein